MRPGAQSDITGGALLPFRRRLPGGHAANREACYRLYLIATGIDDDPLRRGEAAAFYLQAISFDPSFPWAYVGLANLRFVEGRDEAACDLYRAALGVDNAMPEAHFNLGHVLVLRALAAGPGTGLWATLLEEASMHLTVVAADDDIGPEACELLASVRRLIAEAGRFAGG